MTDDTTRDPSQPDGGDQSGSGESSGWSFEDLLRGSTAEPSAPPTPPATPAVPPAGDAATTVIDATAPAGTAGVGDAAATPEPLGATSTVDALAFSAVDDNPFDPLMSYPLSGSLDSESFGAGNGDGNGDDVGSGDADNAGWSRMMIILVSVGAALFVTIIVLLSILFVRGTTPDDQVAPAGTESSTPTPSATPQRMNTPSATPTPSTTPSTAPSAAAPVPVPVVTPSAAPPVVVVPPSVAPVVPSATATPTATPTASPTPTPDPETPAPTDTSSDDSTDQ